MPRVRPLVPIGVLVAGAALVSSASARAADEEAPAPLRPRFETPSELEAKRKVPAFRKPSDPANASDAKPNGGTEKDDGQAPRTGFAPTLGSTPHGYMRDWLAEQSFTPPKSDKMRHATFFGRPQYSYTTGGFHDWSGAEVGGRFDVARGFGASLLVHHENRDAAGQFVHGALATALICDVHLVSSVGLGTGAHFLPMTTLDAEVRAPLPWKKAGRFGVGLGHGSWSESRQDASLSLRYLNQFTPTLGGEARTVISALGSPTMETRPSFFSTVGIAIGRERLQWIERVTVGLLPSYQPGRWDVHDAATLDVAFGFRHFISPSYDHALSLEVGGQAGAFARVGLDYTLYILPW